MRTRTNWVVILISLNLVAAALGQAGIGTTFTYQGQLKQNGVPVNGSVNMAINLWDAATGGNIAGPVMDPGPVQVTNGLFTVPLNYGDSFNGFARWLEINVNGTTLAPRQPITAAPYALSLAPGATIYGGANGLNAITLYHDDAATNALYAYQNATNGTALYGESDVGASAKGIWGITSDGIGVYGQSSGGAAGVAGDNTGGYGVRGQSGEFSGVFGQSTSGAGVTGNSSTGNGVDGVSNSSTGSGAGVAGYSPSGDGVFGVSGDGYGVYGHSVESDGVHGLSDALLGVGVMGEADGGTNAVGVYGYSFYGNGVRGVYGTVSTVNVGPFAKPAIWGDSGDGNGVMGTSAATGGAAVVGYHPANVGVLGFTNTGFGLYGFSTSGAGYAGYFQGRTATTGTKSFQIDHPLDPENKTLTHYCAEGPEPQNIYNGIVTTDAQGFGWVQLPDYFEEINKDFRYQLTVVNDGGTDFVMAMVTQKVAGHRFQVRTSRPNVEVSWEVKGVRNDRFVRTYGAPVEQVKPEHERGKYLHPELYGQPPEMGMNYDAARATSGARSPAGSNGALTSRTSAESRPARRNT